MLLIWHFLSTFSVREGALSVTATVADGGEGNMWEVKGQSPLGPYLLFGLAHFTGVADAVLTMHATHSDGFFLTIGAKAKDGGQLKDKESVL